MLCFIAAATSRVHIATRVLGVPYRSPALVAKMAESLSRLSEGRLILGLGGGSADDEHRAFGLGVRTPREKTTGLEEALTIIRGLWSQSSFTFAGGIYNVDDATISPRPERPIPIWLGTFAPRALSVTGRLGDGWIPSHGYVPLADLQSMHDRVTVARAAGRDPATFDRIYNVPVRIAERVQEEESTIVGPPESVADRLAELAQVGFTGFNFMLATDDPTAAEVVAAELMPALRQRLDW